MAEDIYRAKYFDSYVYGARITLINGGKNLRFKSHTGTNIGIGRTSTLEKLIGYDRDGNEIWDKIEISVPSEEYVDPDYKCIHWRSASDY